MLRIVIALLFAFNGIVNAQVADPLTPDRLYGQLFTDVQLNRIFPDSKTFVDCIPLHAPAEIAAKYETEKIKHGFNLKAFVLKNFRLPPEPMSYSSQEKDIRQHITGLWKELKRSADTVNEGCSLLPLPHPYIVPGGRFREIYYWDSYFTMQGLKESGEYEMMENMVKNFAYLIDRYDHIPNGNRSYYLSRSQPPFFSLMVELLMSVNEEKKYRIFFQYKPVMQKEYDYWYTDPYSDLTATGRDVVVVDDSIQNIYLSKYADELFSPRPESYYEDNETAEKAVLEFRKVVRFADSNQLKRATDSIYKMTCNNLRSAAASGWDFSSRWMKGEALYHTQTNSIVPVDLNCLLHHLQVFSLIKEAFQGPLDSPGNSIIQSIAGRNKFHLRKIFFQRTAWLVL